MMRFWILRELSKRIWISMGMSMRTRGSIPWISIESPIWKIIALPGATVKPARKESMVTYIEASLSARSPGRSLKNTNPEDFNLSDLHGPRTDREAHRLAT